MTQNTRKQKKQEKRAQTREVDTMDSKLPVQGPKVLRSRSPLFRALVQTPPGFPYITLTSLPVVSLFPRLMMTAKIPVELRCEKMMLRELGGETIGHFSRSLRRTRFRGKCSSTPEEAPLEARRICWCLENIL